MHKYSSLEAIEFFLHLILFFLRDCVEMFRSISRFVGLNLGWIFSVINVKSRRGFAVSVECERSDDSVNQGGKIKSNLYVCMHTVPGVPLNCL